MVTYSAEAKGIPKKAISTSDQWATGDIPDLSSLYQATGGKNAANGYAGLNGSTKISETQIPDLSPTYQKVTSKNVANGYAGLDSSAKVPNSLLPTTVVRTDQTNTFGAFAQLFQALYFEIVDGTDATKIMKFDNSGMTTGKTLTIKPLLTTTQTLQIPNISTTDTLATLGLTQTFTGNPVTIDTLKLGANNADANAKKITNLGAPTAATDAARANTLQTKSLAIGTCSDGQRLKYQTSNSTWICADSVPSNYVTLWSATYSTALANQGLNLAAASTELDNVQKGARTLIESTDLANNIQCHINVSELSTRTVTPVISIVDSSNPSTNILCTFTITGCCTASTNYIAKTSYAAKPAWLTGDVTLTVYTSGGDANADFIFKEISISSKP